MGVENFIRGWKIGGCWLGLVLAGLAAMALPTEVKKRPTATVPVRGQKVDGVSAKAAGAAGISRPGGRAIEGSHNVYFKKRPTGTVPVLGQKVDAAITRDAVTAGINYHGGPVMEGPHNVYFIWYGNWSGNTATSILPEFVANLNGSSYFNINASYFDNSRHVPNSVSMANQIFDSFSQGTTLTDDGVVAVVNRATFGGGLPLDGNGIYFVLTSADVDNTSSGGFCTKQCGFHTHFTNLINLDIKYAFVGNPDRCLPFKCAAQSVGPNGNAGADAMASIIAHELAETVTDPDLNAWVDVAENGDPQENADRCAGTFGSTFTTLNGAQANVTLGGRNYLLQQNWVNSGPGFCALAFQTLPVCYQAHVEDVGWQPQVCDGDVAGTVGQSRRMEAIKITAPGRSICYQAYLENDGLQGVKCDGAPAGTTDRGLRMEALKVWIQSGGGHTEYFGHVQDTGWTGPVRDGEIIGTIGASLRLEAVVLRILP
ncbi:MAG TPA: hypothetical protein VF173_33005 [Thermoanaerobaculia bacterium]|nr:hypothetical protein [Thermoanaerobaculia bacterium]